MEIFIHYIIYFHAICGFLALMFGGIAITTKKGSLYHRKAGIFYFWGMTGVFITAVFVSIMHEHPFLLMVGFFSYHMICTGYRALYLKNQHLDQKAEWIDWLISVIAGLFNISLIIWGIYTFQKTGNQIGIVAIVFGLIGSRLVYTNTRKFIKKPEEKNHWIMSHIGGMMGGYIATSTAFLVVNISFLPQLVIWLAPAAIGVPFIYYQIGKFKSTKG